MPSSLEATFFSSPITVYTSPCFSLYLTHLDRYLPHQEPLVRGDPRLEEPNDTLLFVANLGNYPKRSFRGFSSMTSLVMYQFMSALRTHSLFQRYGQVRMLIWVENDEKDTILPQSVSARRKAAIEAEISCQIQEVASSTTRHNYPRDRNLELQSTRFALEKMEKMGVSTPQGRESSCLEELLSGVVCDLRKVGSIGTSDAFLKELSDLEAQYAAGKLGEWEYKDGPTLKPKMRTESPELARLRTLRYLEKHQRRKFEKRECIKAELDEVLAMQRELHATKQPKRQAQEGVMKHRTDAWKRKMDDLPEEVLENTVAYLDNCRIFDMKPRTLMWDRRDYEPLKVRANEFLPMREMCLLDFQPKSIWPILKENFPDNYDAFEYILSQLLIIPTQNIRRGFSALAPGAYDYLIAECPSLTDPTKGGSLDVELISVRCLTTEMLKEIIEAWVRWPFKPNRFEIMSKLGSEAWDPDASATDQSND
jgi:mitochondrial transcription factor 1